jgi:hypothetical protein
MSEPQGGRQGGAARPSPWPNPNDGTAVVHLFRRRGAGYCLSRGRSGSNIPPGLNGETWAYVRDLGFAPGEPRIVFDTTLAFDELDRVGFVLIGAWHDSQ